MSSETCSFLDYFKEKVTNFVNFTNICSNISDKVERDKYIESQLDSIMAYIIENLPRLRHDIFVSEYQYLVDQFGDQNDLPPIEIYLTNVSFVEFFTTVFDTDDKDQGHYKIIRSTMLSTLIDKLIPTLGIVLGRPDMINDPKFYFENNFPTLDDKLKLSRYLDCFYDALLSLADEETK